MTKSTRYRPCVGIALINKSGGVFIGRRKGGSAEHVAPGYEWQMPQGGIDDGETPYEAALRELYEETNIKSVSLLAQAPDWYSYDLPASVLRNWKEDYIGQRQKWFALRFEGRDDEIDIAHPSGHHAEFDAWRWERLERLPELIIPFKRPVYEQVVAAFAPLIAGS